MAHRAKPAVVTAPAHPEAHTFSYLLAAPFAAIGEALSAVIAANRHRNPR